MLSNGYEGLKLKLLKELRLMRLSIKELMKGLPKVLIKLLLKYKEICFQISMRKSHLI